MLNPFTYFFFNPVLHHVVCEERKEDMFIMQQVYSAFHFLYGVGLFLLLLRLESRSFRGVLRGRDQEEILKQGFQSSSSMSSSHNP